MFSAFEHCGHRMRLSGVGVRRRMEVKLRMPEAGCCGEQQSPGVSRLVEVVRQTGRRRGRCERTGMHAEASNMIYMLHKRIVFVL